jgi:hypothetical protein
MALARPPERPDLGGANFVLRQAVSRARQDGRYGVLPRSAPHRWSPAPVPRIPVRRDRPWLVRVLQKSYNDAKTRAPDSVCLPLVRLDLQIAAEYCFTTAELSLDGPAVSGRNRVLRSGLKLAFRLACGSRP